MFQQLLLQEIRKRIQGNASLNDAVSRALDIGYDAAHRRTSDKSKLSFEEAVSLAKYFNISLDGLLEHTDRKIVAVQKTLSVSNEHELEAYYRSSMESLKPLLKTPDVSILYSAKDIPIFYTLENKTLGKFKAYVYLKLFDDNFKNTSYENYIPKKSLLQAGEELGKLYEQFTSSEIWDVTTVNSMLKQIHFYFKAEQMSSDSALELLTALANLIRNIEEKLRSNDRRFLVYYNELLLMSNTVLVKSDSLQSFYIPFNTLSYFLTNDEATCKEAQTNFSKVLKSSKLLNTAGEMEQKRFFNKIYNKIDVLSDLVSATKNLDFE